jgi:GT2 family glycosyltransferase
MEKVIAVVVSGNCPSLLARCIAALKNQTHKLDAIVIIDSKSNYDLDKRTFPKDIFFLHQKDTDTTQGFVAGIEWAYKQRYSWIWCMEDNGYPKEDALQKMLEADSGRLCLYNTSKLNNTDEKTFAQKINNYGAIDEITTKLIHGIGYPLNGIMIHRNIVERVGIPKQKLFLSGYEAEYYYRITRKNSIPVCTVAGSIYYNPVVEPLYKKDWDYKNDWKIYFYIRNRLQVSKARFNTKLAAYLNYCVFLFAITAAIMVYQKTDRIKKMRFLFWPAIDAFANNFSITPQIIIERLNNNLAGALNTSFNNYLHTITSLVVPSFTLHRRRRTADA